jgi:hypothetical protein
MRRTHLRGHQNILKRLLIHVAAFNLSLILRQEVGAGTPRGLQDRRNRFFFRFWVVWMLWPRLGSIDINGSPKIIHRDVLAAMDLQSKQWFLDPEMMVKAHYLGVRVIEMNVFARMRSNGLSHVRPTTCLEFFVNLLRFKFGGSLAAWRKRGPHVMNRPEISGT